jgi:ADP-ribose pyrophosphatase YjhB (NUDIX family)
MHRSKEYRYCPLCGGILENKLLKQEEHERLVCSGCQFVFYLDPKVVACIITEIDGQIVMVRRGISPGFGLWVIPGGFVDVGETVADAAVREIWEEVRLKVVIDSLVGVYSYTGISSVIIVYEATVLEGLPQACDETLEVRLFSPKEIPWEDIAFTSTRDALRDYLSKKHPDVFKK